MPFRSFSMPPVNQSQPSNFRPMPQPNVVFKGAQGIVNLDAERTIKSQNEAIETQGAIEREKAKNQIQQQQNQEFLDKVNIGGTDITLPHLQKVLDLVGGDLQKATQFINLNKQVFEMQNQPTPEQKIQQRVNEEAAMLPVKAEEAEIKSGISLQEFMNKQEVQRLSGDSVRIFESATTGAVNTKLLREKIEGGSKLFAPSLLDRDLDAIMSDMSDQIGRLRSGGAITEDEEKRFRELLPTALDSKGTKLNKLRRLELKFNLVGRNVATPKRFEEAVNYGVQFLNDQFQPENQNAGSQDLTNMKDEDLLNMLYGK